LLGEADLAAIVEQAKALWTEALGAGDGRLSILNDVQVQIGNLPDRRLGATLGNTILIDSDAAGYGWFVGGITQSPAGSGRMDLLTVVAHELGNSMGFAEDAHATAAVTSPMLGAGERHLPGADGALDAAPVAPMGDQKLLKMAMQAAAFEAAQWKIGAAGHPGPSFDFDTGSNAVGASGGIDWQARSAAGWGNGLSPFGGGSGSWSSNNISEFLMRTLGSKDQTAADDDGYDSMGRSLRSTSHPADEGMKRTLP